MKTVQGNFLNFSDRFDKVDDYQDGYSDNALVFTQKSSTNHVILDGIHEISFRLELPKGLYVYLHKQKDRLLLNNEDKVNVRLLMQSMFSLEGIMTENSQEINDCEVHTVKPVTKSFS